MAATTVAELVIKLSAQTVELQKGLQQAESKIESFTRGVNKVLGGLTAAAALYKLQAAIMGVVTRAADLSKLSEKIGIPMQEFAGFAAAAQDIGMSSEAMGQGVKFLSRSMQEATQGGGEAKEVFKALNIQFQISPGVLRPTAEVVLQLADTFSAMDDGATKTALSVKLFGRAGIEMIPFLNQGREAIEKMIASNVKMGAVMDSDLGQKARAFKLTLNEIKDASDGLTIAFTAALLSTLQKIAKVLQDTAENANGLKTAMQGLVDFIEAGIVLAGITLFLKFAAAIGGVIIAAGGLGPALAAAAEAISAVLLLNPEIAGIMLIAASLYTVYLMWKQIPPEVDKAAEAHKRLSDEIKKLKPAEQKQQIDVYTQAVADMRREIEDTRATMRAQESFGDTFGTEESKKKIDEMIAKLNDYRFHLGLLKTIAGKGIETPVIADPGVLDTLKKKMIELKASFADFGPPAAKSRAAFKATLDAIVEGKGPISLYKKEIDALIATHNKYIATETSLKVNTANIQGDLAKAESYWASYVNDLEIDYSNGIVDLSDYYEERKRVLVEKTAAEVEALKKELAVKTTTEERKVAINVEIKVKGEQLDAALKKETDAGKKAAKALAESIRAGELQGMIDRNSLDLVTIEGQFADGLLAIQEFYDKRRAIIEAEANKEIANIQASIDLGLDPAAQQKAEDQIKAIRARAGLDIAKSNRAQLEDTRANYKQMQDAGMAYAQQKADLAWGEIDTLKATQGMELMQREQKDQEELAQLRAVKGDTIIIEGEAVDKLEAERDMIGAQTMRKKKLLVDQETQLELKKYELAAGVAKGTGDLFGELYEMSGKKVKAFFYMQKAAAVAEAIINVAAGVTAALKLGPIIGPIMAGIVTAMGAAQIAKIMAQTIKGAEKGGPIKEGSGTKDDVLIRVMKGEFIQPKGVVQYYGMNFMEALRRKLIPRDAFSGSLRGKAKGGPITEGSGVKDDVLIKVMRGEYVQTKEAVAYYGLNVMEAIRRKLIPRDAFRDVPFFPVMMPQMAFATGGVVAGGGVASAGSSEVSNSVTVPVTVYGGDHSLASKLRGGIEEVVVKILREHTR